MNALAKPLSNKTAVAYVRRSTDRQEQSIGDQRRAIQSYAQTHGYDILEFYTDDAISGASTNDRVEFLRLIRDSQQGNCPFRHVLVYDVKRWSRGDNDETGFYRYQLRSKNIEIVYISEGFNGDDSEDLLRPVKQWQARQELKDLSKVTIRGLLTRVEGGWWNGGVPTFGYDLAYYSGTGEFICVVRFQPDGSRHVLDEHGALTRVVPKGDAIQFTKRDRSRLVPSSPDRVELIRTIYDWYTVEGYGYKGIAQRLNREHLPAPFGNSRRTNLSEGWCGSTVASILKNPIYTGDMVWNRLSFAKFHRITDGIAVPIRTLPSNSCIQNSEENWIVVRDSHQALISRTLFEQSQQRRAQTAKFGIANKGNVGRGARSPFLLTGLIKCTHCGHNWMGCTMHKGRRKPDHNNITNLYYECGGVHKGKQVCERFLIPKAQFEQWVVGKINEMLQAQFCKPQGLASLSMTIVSEPFTVITDFSAARTPSAKRPTIANK